MARYSTMAASRSTTPPCNEPFAPSPSAVATTSSPDPIAADRAAVFYTLLGSAKLNGLDPEAFLRHVLTHMSNHPIRHRGSPAVEPRPKPAPSKRARSIRRARTAQNPIADLLPTLAGFINDGEITVGLVHPVG